ncbi:hypothetical protein EDB83DRAFT_1445969 [Lactarius deliciosus]|nr:hypothetical protein EDB83DRAFT_1445969 [Lactarius deliciosus]
MCQAITAVAYTWHNLLTLRARIPHLLATCEGDRHFQLPLSAFPRHHLLSHPPVSPARHFLPHRLSRPYLPPFLVPRSRTTCVMPTLPTPRCRVRFDRYLSRHLPSFLSSRYPLAPFSSSSHPPVLSVPLPHSLPSHMSATVGFVLLLAGISSPRPSFHHPPLSLSSQSLPFSELSPSAPALLSPVPYPHTFSFSFLQSHSPRRPLAAPLALSAPSSSPCLTSAELCQPSANALIAIPTISLPALLFPHAIHLLPTHPLILPSTCLRHHLPCSGTLSPSCMLATRTARHPPCCRGRRHHLPIFTLACVCSGGF